MDEMIAAAGRLSYKCNFHLFTPDKTNVVWPATTPGSSLRRLILDFYISNVWVGDFEHSVDQLHPEFIWELMLAALNKVNHRGELITPFDRVAEESCYYHGHNDKFLKGDCLKDK